MGVSRSVIWWRQFPLSRARPASFHSCSRPPITGLPYLCCQEKPGARARIALTFRFAVTRRSRPRAPAFSATVPAPGSRGGAVGQAILPRPAGWRGRALRSKSSAPPGRSRGCGLLPLAARSLRRLRAFRFDPSRNTQTVARRLGIFPRLLGPAPWDSAGGKFLQVLFEHHRVVLLGVAGAVDQCNRSIGQPGGKRFERLPVCVQLRPVAPFELIPL